MRRIFILAALAALALYLTNKRRRDQIAETVREYTPPDLQQRAQETAGRLQGQAQQATQAVREGATGAAQRAQQAAQSTAETASKAADNGAASLHTDVDTPAPSVRQTVRDEVAGVAEKVDALRAQAEAPTDRAEDSAQSTGSGSVADRATAEQADAQGTVSATPDAERSATSSAARETGDESIAPVGQRPRPIAGEATATPGGGTPNPLSAAPIAEGQTATGVAEPLPEGLTEGEPGTGGPKGSSRAPATPDSTASPTIGMEQPPRVDHTQDIGRRTSGKFVGNKTTRIFHAASAGNLPGKNNRVYFETEEEAVAAGFRPAENEGLSTAES